MAKTFIDSQYVYILTEYKFKREESILLEFNIPKSKSIHVLVKDHQKHWLLYEYSLKKAKIRVPKGKDLFLLFYEEGITPELQTMKINSEKDTTIGL